MKKRPLRFILYGFIGVTLLCLAVVGISALSNLYLPSQSPVTERLSDLDKARLAEAIHLRQSLGDVVWPSWGQLDIPFILYNEEYAFLVGYPDPADGWVKIPQDESRGGPWQAVPDDDYQGQVYFRQQLSSPEITPQNFTVLVGDRWVASMQTKEYAEIDFYAGFREELPPFIRAIFPYRLAWGLLMGETENYISALAHEAFHAFQGDLAPSRLYRAELAAQNDDFYPWADQALDEAWKLEADSLVRAVQSQTDEEAAEYARQFLAQREKRRVSVLLSADLVDYERQREWLEGVAKYVEVSIGRLAAEVPGYAPQGIVMADPDFKHYKNRQQYWSGQIEEARRTSGRGGETRFYYSGLTQAVLLDRLMPGWKERALDEGVTLEDLLREAVDG